MDRIVVTERGGALVLAARGEGGWTRTPLAASGRWPAWHPGGELLAASTVEAHGNEQRGFIALSSIAGGASRLLHDETAATSPLIGPRVPHYCYWSPRGDLLAYVARSGDTLALYVSHVNATFTAREILRGAPLFFDWSPDGAWIAVHEGPRLFLVETARFTATKVVGDDALGFRTPAFSDDGQLLAYATANGSAAEVWVTQPGDFFSANPIRRYPGGAVLGFRPRSRELTVARAKQPDSGAFDELWIIDADNPQRERRLARGPFVGFFWAPGGEKVALVVPTQSGDGRYAVHVRDPGGAFVAATEPILPAEDLRLLLAFFDQYARSHRLWAPDGSALLLAGRIGGDGVSSSWGDPEGDVVFSWAARRGAPLERVQNGEIGFYPPPPAGPGG